MKNLSNERQGEIILLLETLLWSFFPIITILASSVPALFSAAISTMFATMFFAILLTIQNKWKEFKVTLAWKDILLSTLLIGIIFYALVFIGTERTTAGNTAIIFLMQIFFSYIFFNIWKKEDFSIQKAIGAIVMIIGAVIILFPGEIVLNKGDIILLIAMMITPAGSYYLKEARKNVSSTLIMFIRSLISSIFLFLIAFTFQKTPSIEMLQSTMLFFFINGFLLLGFSKILWIEAIHRMSVTKAFALSTVTPAFTLIFAYFILNEIPTIWQIFGFIPILAGGIMIISRKDLITRFINNI